MDTHLAWFQEHSALLFLHVVFVIRESVFMFYLNEDCLWAYIAEELPAQRYCSVNNFREFNHFVSKYLVPALHFGLFNVQPDTFDYLAKRRILFGSKCVDHLNAFIITLSSFPRVLEVHGHDNVLSTKQDEYNDRRLSLFGILTEIRSSFISFHLFIFHTANIEFDGYQQILHYT